MRSKTSATATGSRPAKKKARSGGCAPWRLRAASRSPVDIMSAVLRARSRDRRVLPPEDLAWAGVGPSDRRCYSGPCGACRAGSALARIGCTSIASVKNRLRVNGITSWGRNDAAKARFDPTDPDPLSQAFQIVRRLSHAGMPLPLNGLGAPALKTGDIARLRSREFDARFKDVVKGERARTLPSAEIFVVVDDQGRCSPRTVWRDRSNAGSIMARSLDRLLLASKVSS